MILLKPRNVFIETTISKQVLHIAINMCKGLKFIAIYRLRNSYRIVMS